METATAVNAGRQVTDTVKKAGRLLYLDNLKVFLIVLVIVHHAGQPYGYYAGDWPVHEANVPEICAQLLGWFFSVNGAFFMGLFFLVSAYFLPASFDRKGATKYVKDRLLRLGLPIPIVVLIGFPVLGFLFYAGRMSFPSYLTDVFFNFSSGGSFTFGYMWFVVWLLIFSCGYAAYRVLTRDRARPSKKLPVPGHLAILGFAAVVAIACFAVRIWSPPGNWIFYHVLEPARLPQYVALFAVGILAYRNDWMSRMPWSTAKVWGALAVLAIVGFPLLFLTIGDTMWQGGLTVSSLALAAWESLLGTGLVVALPVLFRERFNVQGTVLKTMSDNVYPVYLIHVPILIGLQAMLANVDMFPLFKFAIVAIVGVPFCFITSNYPIRNIPGSRYVL